MGRQGPSPGIAKAVLPAAEKRRVAGQREKFATEKGDKRELKRQQQTAAVLASRGRSKGGEGADTIFLLAALVLAGVPLLAFGALNYHTFTVASLTRPFVTLRELWRQIVEDYFTA